MTRLTGRQATNYQGVQSSSPPNFQSYRRTPTTTDWQNFYLGDLWLVDNKTIPEDKFVYILVSLRNNLAQWVRFAGVSGGILSLTSNSVGTILPDADGNLFVIGDVSTIIGVGNPLDNTITFSVVGGRGAQSFPTDDGTAVPISGVLNIFGGPNINTDALFAANTIHINLNTSIIQPPTIASGTVGMYALGSSDFINDRFMYSIGTNNTFLGRQSGTTTLSGTGNTAIGSHVLTAVTSGFSNTAVGDHALSGMTDGSLNTALGVNSLTSTTSAIQNTAIGTNANQFCTTGQSNTSIGCFALLSGTSGSLNTAVGFDSLTNCDTGSSNTALGSQTLGNITNGVNNLAFGRGSGDSLTGVDSNNIYINNVGVASENNTIRIGTQGSGAAQQNKAFCAGIRGVVTDANDGVPVVVSSTGQLGTDTFYFSAAWTPVLSFGGASVGITYTTQSGTYTKIGNMVFFFCTIVCTKGSSTGNAAVNGLPIAALATPPFWDCDFYTGIGLTLDAGYTVVHCGVVGGTTRFEFVEDSNNGQAGFTLDDSYFGAAINFSVQGFYRVA